MSRRLSGPIGVALLVAVTGTTAAFAEDAPAPSAAPAGTDTPGPSAAPAPSGSAPADTTAAPAGSGSAAPAPGAPTHTLVGYGYGGRRSSSAAATSSAPRHHMYPHHADEAVASFVGFEMLADGGSRLFVQLSKQVDVEPEKADAPKHAGKAKAAGKSESQVVSRIKFVIKGAEVLNPINEGSLVTVHFNTPIVRSRLVPAGKNLALMVELRADVTPEVKFVPAKDNGSMLQIDFPQGSYLPAGDAEAAPEPSADATANGASLPPTPAPPSASGAAAAQPQQGGHGRHPRPSAPAGANDSTGQ